MASYVVPPKNKPIIKCRCGTMYVSDNFLSGFAEDCPICHYDANHISSNSIPLWKYNIIKWFRGGFKNERHN